MRKGSYTFVRAHRRRWGLSQRELALLLNFADSSSVSRIERAKRVPTIETIIACCVIFELSMPELFPPMYDDVEETVLTAAKALYDELEEKTDKRSALKRSLLEDILARATGRNQSKQP